MRIQEVSQYKFLFFRYKRDNKRVCYVIIAEGKVTSHEKLAEYVGAVVRRGFHKIGVLKHFTKFSRKHQCQGPFFNKVEGRRPQACNFIKKETPTEVVSCDAKLWRQAPFLQKSCGWLLLNILDINCHKVSVSELIISKCYTEVERGGRSKLVLPIHIIYQKCTLLKRLF